MLYQKKTNSIEIGSQL